MENDLLTSTKTKETKFVLTLILNPISPLHAEFFVERFLEKMFYPYQFHLSNITNFRSIEDF